MPDSDSVAATAQTIFGGSTVWVGGPSLSSSHVLSPDSVSPAVYRAYLDSSESLSSDASIVTYSPAPIPLFSSHQTDILERSFELFIQLDRNNDHKMDLLEFVRALNLFASQIRAEPVRLEEAALIMDTVIKSSPATTALAPTANTPSVTPPAPDSPDSAVRDPPFLTFSEFHTVHSALNVLRQLQASDLGHLRMKDVKEALIKSGINPTQAQLDRMFLLGDQYKTLDRQGPLSFMEFLRLYSHQPFDAKDVFIHSWWAAGKNSVPYNKPVEVSPIQDFIAGTMAGITLTLVGHPFDLIKVRLQTQNEAASLSKNSVRRFRNGFDCFWQTVKNEGVMALFKGMSSPMATIPLVNAIVFAAYGHAKDTIHKWQTEKKPLSLWQITAAGAYAGFVNCFIICPVELVKTRLQIQYQPRPIKLPSLPPLSRPPGSILTTREMAALAASLPNAAAAAPAKLTHIGQYGQTFSGPVDCIKKIVEANGLKGLFRGMSATIYREVPGYGGQFFAYEALKRAFTKEGEKVSDLRPMHLIVAGGLAGIMGWCVSYPMDYVKSQIQAEAYDRKTPYRKHPILLDGGFIDCWKRTVEAQGHRALWRGFGVCVARAFPANAAGFVAYEATLKWLQKVDQPLAL